MTHEYGIRLEKGVIEERIRLLVFRRNLEEETGVEIMDIWETENLPDMKNFFNLIFDLDDKTSTFGHMNGFSPIYLLKIDFNKSVFMIWSKKKSAWDQLEEEFVRFCEMMSEAKIYREEA